MSSPRWIYRLWIGCVSTRAMLVPAGTVIEVGPGAGGADAGASGGVVCESHCEAVCNCATEDKVTNRMVVKTRVCLALDLARDRKATKFDTARRQRSLDMWYLLINVRWRPKPST